MNAGRDEHLAVQSNRWYQGMIIRLVGHRQPTRLAYRSSINGHSSLSQEEMLALLRQVSPSDYPLPLMLVTEKIAGFNDVLSCITLGGEFCPQHIRNDHIQVCRIGRHWAVVLVIWLKGSLHIFVYHPGHYCRTGRVEVPWGRDVLLCIRGARYQTDDNEDSCATFAVWGSLYVPRFLKAHADAPYGAKVPHHIPWFTTSGAAKEVDAACSEFLWGG